MATTPFELRLTNKQSIFVESLVAASDTFQKFIHANNLGSSGLQRYAGDVRVDGKKVAHISYNGRMWTPEKWPKCREILPSGIIRQIEEAK